MAISQLSGERLALPRYGWDKQVDFVEAKGVIESQLLLVRGEASKDSKSRARLASYGVLLTQELNGSRISEAYDALLQWARDGSREQKVVVRKHRKRCSCNHSIRKHELVEGERMKCNGEGCSCLVYSADENDVEHRLMIVPPAVLEEDRQRILLALERGTTVDAIIEFSRRNLGFNTHSLRYAFISKQAKDNVPAQTVAKITHHKKLDYIVDYTQQQVADETLRKTISGA